MTDAAETGPPLVATEEEKWNAAIDEARALIWENAGHYPDGRLMVDDSDLEEAVAAALLRREENAIPPTHWLAPMEITEDQSAAGGAAILDVHDEQIVKPLRLVSVRDQAERAYPAMRDAYLRSNEGKSRP